MLTGRMEARMLEKQKSRKSQRGAAALEFALVIPVLMALVCGMMDFAMVFNGQAVVTNGIRGVLASPSLLALPAINSASRFAHDGLVVVDAVPSGGPPMRLQVPTLVLLDHTDPPQLSWLAATEGPLRIVVLPASTRDPMYPDDLVKNVRGPHWALEDFLRRL